MGKKQQPSGAPAERCPLGRVCCLRQPAVFLSGTLKCSGVGEVPKASCRGPRTKQNATPPIFLFGGYSGLPTPRRRGYSAAEDKPTSSIVANSLNEGCRIVADKFKRFPKQWLASPCLDTSVSEGSVVGAFVPKTCRSGSFVRNVKSSFTAEASPFSVARDVIVPASKRSAKAKMTLKAGKTTRAKEKDCAEPKNNPTRNTSPNKKHEKKTRHCLRHFRLIASRPRVFVKRGANPRRAKQRA